MQRVPQLQVRMFRNNQQCAESVVTLGRKDGRHCIDKTIVASLGNPADDETCDAEYSVNENESVRKYRAALTWLERSRKSPLRYVDSVEVSTSFSVELVSLTFGESWKSDISCRLMIGQDFNNLARFEILQSLCNSHLWDWAAFTL